MLAKSRSRDGLRFSDAPLQVRKGELNENLKKNNAWGKEIA